MHASLAMRTLHLLPFPALQLYLGSFDSPEAASLHMSNLMRAFPAANTVILQMSADSSQQSTSSQKVARALEAMVEGFR
jgi:hypothetical protein